MSCDAAPMSGSDQLELSVGNDTSCWTFTVKALLCVQDNQERARQSREQQRERELQFKRQQRERANQGAAPFFLKKCKIKHLFCLCRNVTTVSRSFLW